MSSQYHPWSSLLVNVRTVLVYLLCSAWRILVGLVTMKKLRQCCCFWAPREDQYKLVATSNGGQELITIRPKVYSTE